MHKTRGEYVCIHAFAQVLCKKVKEPLIVMVSGGGGRGGMGGTERLGAGWEENFTFYCLNFFLNHLHVLIFSKLI